MTNLAAQRPVAKRIGILIEELGDETVLYDPSSSHFVSLNAVAYFVWKRCDGETSVSQIVGALELEHGLEDASEVVWLAVHLLSSEGLFDGDVVVPEAGDAEEAEGVGRSMSRRTMLAIAGVGLAAPVVGSLVAPLPAAAQSSPGPGGPPGPGSGGGSSPIDCVVSDWGSFSSCTRFCGGGTQSRSRTVVTSPANGGTPCPALTETRNCNDEPCPVDCVVTAWSDWSPCSEPCGGGTQNRTRSVTTSPAFGGSPCPSLTESQSCNSDPCP